MEDDFAAVIKERLVGVQGKIKNQNVRILNPGYYSRRVTEALQEAVGAIDPGDGEQLVIEQLVQIINKTPSFVAETFTSALQESALLKQEFNVWATVDNEWQSYEAQILEDKKKKDELKAAVVAGEIEERTTQTRREPGNHPGPSTREIRNVKAELEEEVLPGLEESGS
tara:strand:- start:2658 stop:3164 length:507 start_codon:yes stop_codon:yes gene_type:complete